MKITTAHIKRVARTVRDDLRELAEMSADAINQERAGAGLPSIDAKPGRPRLEFRFGYGADASHPEEHADIDWCDFAGSVPTVTEVHDLANHPRLRVRWIEVQGWPCVRVTSEINGRRCDDNTRATRYGAISTPLWDDAS